MYYHVGNIFDNLIIYFYVSFHLIILQGVPIKSAATLKLNKDENVHRFALIEKERESERKRDSNK